MPGSRYIRFHGVNIRKVNETTQSRHPVQMHCEYWSKEKGQKTERKDNHIVRAITINKEDRRNRERRVNEVALSNWARESALLVAEV